MLLLKMGQKNEQLVVQDHGSREATFHSTEPLGFGGMENGLRNNWSIWESGPELEISRGKPGS